MTRTNYLLDDAGGSLPWGALSSFIGNLRTDSALARDLGKSTGWEDTLQTNTILADMYDLMQAIYRVVVLANKGKPGRLEPYPRPGKENNTRRIGKGALPPDQLHKWIEERQSHGKRS